MGDASTTNEPRFALPDELHASVLAGLLLVSGFVAGLVRGVAGPAAMLAWASLGIGFVYGGRAAWASIRQLRVDIDVLMIVAAVLAAAMGQPAEGALLLVLFTLSGALEKRAKRRTMRAVEALHGLMPVRALAWRGDAWTEVRPDALVVGERVLIRSGERVPTDGAVVSGRGSIDQSTLTGESLPRDVAEGDEVYAGTLSVADPIEVEVSRQAADSSLQKILDLVVSAQQQREPVQRVIDRLSQPYALGVMGLSLLVFFVWWLALGDSASHAGRTAIALLIVASPCALVIATPTATLAAISRAARAGVLFKGGQSIERLARMTAVCLDKTGTLTRGRPSLRGVRALGGTDPDRLLALAAALEVGSTHPIATAVVEAARALRIPTGESIQDLPGRGLAGVVDGAEARLGTVEHVEELVAESDRAAMRDAVAGARARGELAVAVVGGGAADGSGRLAGVLVLADPIRPGAAEMVEGLHRLGVRPIVMLTGDHPTTAALVAKEVGIDRWEAGLLPADKVRLVREAKRNGGAPRRVGVIGDGVNDAPALAAADVSVAIGSIGSDAALESADIVTLSEDLRVIPWAVALARRTRAIVAFNLSLAVGVIVVMGVLTLVGSRIGRDVGLPIAVVAHEGGTLLVVLNSLRLLGARGVPGHG
ncbi:MAG: heavy metal translocating P-type ATPase [Phycisphaerales bacterium]